MFHITNRPLRGRVRSQPRNAFAADWWRILPLCFLCCFPPGAEAITTASAPPDEWKLGYFGTLSVDPNADADGDGKTNLEEFQAGTNPTDAQSVLKIVRFGIANGHHSVHFPTVAGWLYQLQSSSSLTGAAWSPVGNQVAGTGGELEVIDPATMTADPIFYRVTIAGKVGTGLNGEYFLGTDLVTPAQHSLAPKLSFDWPSGGPAGLPSSYWSARWSGGLTVEQSQTYTFYLGSDDGSRLWVDDQLLIDSWSGHGYYERTGSLFLDASTTHRIRVEYFQYGGGAALQVSWSSPTIAKELIPTANLWATPDYLVNGRHGLEGQYFVDSALLTIGLIRLDPTIYFDWGMGSPDATIPTDYFSVRWRGQFLAQNSETYTFYTHTDDGCRLWVNGALLIDQWGTLGDASASIPLVSGHYYDLRFEFKELTGAAAAQLLWSSPSIPKQVIPTRLLYPPAVTPALLPASVQTAGSVELQWSTTATDQDSFRIERSSDGFNFGVIGNTFGTASTFQDTTVQAGSAYHYRVVAVGAHGDSLPSGTITAVTAAGSVPGSWKEDVLNEQGQVDPAAYRALAAAYGTAGMLDHRFGPKATDFGTPATILTLAPTGSGGWSPQPWDYQNPPETDWFAMSGQLLYAPDGASDPGVARARNGSVYLTNSTTYFDYRIQWTPDPGNYYNVNPDPGVTQPSWQNASGGTLPAPPVAVARSRFMTGVEGALVYQNGLIGITGTGNEPNSLAGRYPFLNLPAGKVPTAACLTLNNEFLLVTVWDTALVKGQVAVIALEGTMVATGSSAEQHYLYGIPNWPSVRSLKLLGFVDLPFQAPTSIEASANFSQNNGRGQGDNATADLSQQAERDTWYSGGSAYKHVASSGYAVVASRADNKVAFLDLQPLYQYYRQMYFTSAANYAQTQGAGPGAGQWPLTFDFAPQQTPVVASVLNVPRPTAVAAGFPRGNCNWWRSTSAAFDDGIFGASAYVATMAGQLFVYDVGGLNTIDPPDVPRLVVSPFVGRNPCQIAYGTQALDANPNDLFVTCRGERTISRVAAEGKVVQTLTDSRLVDPVAVEISNNFRGSVGANYLSVMDFGGKQAINYVARNDSSVFSFGYATPVPGQPFAFRLAEVP